MHDSSYEKMRLFRDRYLGTNGPNMTVCEVGSRDVNGVYRPLFSHERFKYFGIDIIEGRNVDIVLGNPYDWKEVGDSSVDVIVSGSTFEHIKAFWLTILEIERVLKPNGYGCIIAPANGPLHRHPTDCWRYYPDGLDFMVRYARMTPLEVSTDFEGVEWWDSFVAFQKPLYTDKTAMKLRSNLIRFASFLSGTEDPNVIVKELQTRFMQKM